MKLIIALTFASFIYLGNAQTPLIAHKSHAGSSTSYLIVSSSNFGLRRTDFDKQFEQSKPVRSEHFKLLNDSVIILETTDLNQNIIKTDTLKNQNRYAPIIFELKYKDSIQKKEIEENYKREMEYEEELKQQQLESQKQLNQETTPAKKKKKSYILFLFGITGGGMLLMKLLGRSKTVKPSIA